MNTFPPTVCSFKPLRTRIIAGLAIATFSLGIGAGSASAQTASSPPPLSGQNLGRLINPSNAAQQKALRSTEPATSTTTSTMSALEVLNSDADLSEFAAIVKAAGAEGLFSRPEASWTYILPTNSAFAVLDKNQLARLKDPKFKDQAQSVVREHIASGAVALADFTRRLPTGLPAPAPTRVQSCSVIGGSLINGVQVGGTTFCSTIVTAPTIPPAAIDRVTMVSGRTISVRAEVLRDPNGGANRFRVSLSSGAMLETTDYAVRNGVVHTTDTLLLPTTRLSDLVGLR